MKLMLISKRIKVYIQYALEELISMIGQTQYIHYNK